MKNEMMRAPARRPTHPAEVLREDVLPALRMTVSDVAAELKVSRQMLHKVLAGEAAVTPEMALRLGKFCGNGPELWLRIQQECDLWDARRKIGADLASIATHESALESAD